MTTIEGQEAKIPTPSATEGIKSRSRFLRGTLLESLADPLTGALRPDDTQLSKFHGFYQQDDRDIRAERTRQKLEPLYSFMLRICVPGGVIEPRQWLQLDEIAESHGDGGLRVTTRQSVQLHGVLKGSLKPTIASVNRALLSTLAACGDVNRNVMGAPLADSIVLTETLQDIVRQLSRALAPQTRAYHELWLDGVPVPQEQPDINEEPLYGPTYLPRKFKVGVIVPPDNDVDIYTQDLGLVAVANGDELLGFNVLVGGGMGRAHGDESTYPRLGSMLGFVPTDRILDVARAVLAAQRDLGNRSERHHARLKYTIDRLGVEAFRREVETRMGFGFGPERPFVLTSTLDQTGWFRKAQQDHLHIYLPSGRVRDTDAQKLRSAIRELAQVHEGHFRLTGNQNLIVSNVSAHTKAAIDAIVQKYGLLPRRSGLRLAALACVALPTCGLAMAEAERYLPSLVGLLETKLESLGLTDEPIVMRMTGCPNGCARPYNAEVAFVGRAPGLYDLHLGGNRAGTRLARVAATNLNQDAILERMGSLFQRYASERTASEGFGDFCVRVGVV
ncbi:MAG TPA: NADPH-dependent assimilatory sulfite reductase hemoprotein subunit [Polyangiaceae bacterium]|nr:NADPH-dependent assimilatory sulfite reductase hemoprotein subunit [Polyangiaceae bacterium]